MLRVAHQNPIQVCAVFLGIFARLKGCLDQFLREGAASGRLMNFGLHPHVMGHAFRIGALEEFLIYAKSQADVWITNREELATWYEGVHDTHIPVGATALRSP